MLNKLSDREIGQLIHALECQRVNLSSRKTRAGYNQPMIEANLALQAKLKTMLDADYHPYNWRLNPQ